MRFRSLLLLGMCPCVVFCSHVVVFWSVCEFVVVPYVDAVVAVTSVLLFVFMLRECEGDGNAGVWDG